MATDLDRPPKTLAIWSLKKGVSIKYAATCLASVRSSTESDSDSVWMMCPQPTAASDRLFLFCRLVLTSEEVSAATRLGRRPTKRWNALRSALSTATEIGRNGQGISPAQGLSKPHGGSTDFTALHAGIVSGEVPETRAQYALHAARVRPEVCLRRRNNVADVSLDWPCPASSCSWPIATYSRAKRAAKPPTRRCAAGRMPR